MGYTPMEILKIVISNKDKIVDYDRGVPIKLLRLILTKNLDIKGFVKGNKLEEIVKIYAKKKGIESIRDIKMPLAIPIVDLITGGVEYCLSNGIKIKAADYNIKRDNKTDTHYNDIDGYKNDVYIWEAVRASSSFPGVFIPKSIEGKKYIDGGVRTNTPVEILRKMGASKVISVSFDCNSIDKKGIKDIIGITNQSFNILSHDASESEIKNADINIRICLDETSLLDFSKPVKLALEGQKNINNSIDKIKEKLKIL